MSCTRSLAEVFHQVIVLYYLYSVSDEKQLYLIERASHEGVNLYSSVNLHSGVYNAIFLSV